jgi:transposase
MSDGMEELARRLVVGRKRDGRSAYDEAAKAELVAACGKPGASVSRLARECGVNANQLSRWVREHSRRCQRAVAVPIDLRECDLRQAAEVIEALGRVRCSFSTNR